MGQRFHPGVVQHVDSLHKRNLILLHYQAARLYSARPRVSSGADGTVPSACLIRYFLCCEECINLVSVNKTNCQLGTFYPHTPCAMLRQMLLRPSLRPVSRSFPPRTQLPTRAFHHHTHSSKHHRNPRSSYKCCRRIPIQTSSALLQIGPSFQSKRHPTSYIPSSSNTFHSSRRVQGSPIAFIGLFSALKVRPQL
jgi:hypothetical protein